MTVSNLHPSPAWKSGLIGGLIGAGMGGIFICLLALATGAILR